MIQEKVKVLWNKKIGPSYFQMGLECDRTFSNAMPGQFIMLRASEQIDPLLRRPFSIYKRFNIQDEYIGIEILYKVIGKGTELISAYRENDFIDILGPLGNSFSVPGKDKKVFMIAGGVGVPPIAFLASQMGKKKRHLHNVKVFIGGRSKEDILCKDDFKQFCMKLSVFTDDGTEGHKGLVTQSLDREIRTHPPHVIVSCGPVPMLKQVIKIAKKNSIPCFVSIETMMACGLGACVGCVVENRNQPGYYLHACRSGPVFNAADIRL